MRKYLCAAVITIKALFAKLLLLTLYKSILKEDIWLFQEKHTEARDNAYHLYAYVKEKHPETTAYFSIVKGSSDCSKIDKYQTTINADSLIHYIYWLGAKYSVGSQPDGAIPYPIDWVKRLKFLCRKDQKTVFLQHGIIKDDIPSLYFNNTQFDLFICSSEKEYRYIREKYGYPSSNLGLLGMCRFDNLTKSTNNNKQILIMPTFRSWLKSSDPEHEATEYEKQIFKQSAFYNMYANLLTNTRLQILAQNEGYRIVFYLHFALQSYSSCFKQFEDETVLIADREHFDVQQLLIDSSILITDYSSIFFDFAYMRKPEVFFQFDKEDYREKHYQTGYFTYEKDAFGPVYTDIDSVIDYLEFLLKNHCNIEYIYGHRIDGFFAFRDNYNCERNFRAIKKLS